ncbi:MAG: LLM class flavin-dependent oxidoreductase [Sphingobium sp.]
MKFGLLCAPHWPDNYSQRQVYSDVVGHILEAERLGFWSAWVTEHHFASDPDYKPFGKEGRFPAYDVIVDPLSFLGFVASRTTSIRLGTGVMVVHYDDPLRLAERAAMVDLMSGGRLELGLGRGGGKKEPAAFGVPADDKGNQDRYFEALDVIRQAWTSEPFEHKGEYYKYPKITVIPEPKQKPIPVFLSNRNPRAIAYAAEHGMSYTAVTSAWGSSGIDSHNEFHDRFVKLATENGRDVSQCDYPQTLYCYIAPTDAEAVDMAYECIQRRDCFAESHYETRRGGSASPLTPHQAARTTFDEQFKGQLNTNLIGSPKTVAEKLTALRERMPSLNYVLAIVGAGAGPVEFDRRSIQLLATEVMPKFAPVSPEPALERV